MGEQYPEIKGYLMRYKAQEMENVDFFDALSLDWYYERKKLYSIVLKSIFILLVYSIANNVVV